jgi:pSer/pThr/pTyr-binding forkhead associated (FHA) protein
MSALALSLLRLGFLALLWGLVLIVVFVLRRNLMAPTSTVSASPVVAAGQAKPKRPQRKAGRALVVVEGPLKGTSIPLGTAPVTIGRAPTSTVVIDDDYASANHARIVLGDGEWIVEDLGSTNGTFVGDKRVTTPVKLGVGVPLRVGQTVLQLKS